VLGLSKTSRDAAREALEFENQTRVARAKADAEVATLEEARAKAERAKIDLQTAELRVHLAMDEADLQNRRVPAEKR
jgi:hypothetical protein